MAAKGRYVSDRSHLAVSKPNPLNARQEAFFRNIAEGRRQREAYRSAGYAPTSDNATDANLSPPRNGIPSPSVMISRSLSTTNVCSGRSLFYSCLGRDQLLTFRGPDRQVYLFAAAAGRNGRENAISVFWVGCHGAVEQYRVAAF